MHFERLFNYDLSEVKLVDDVMKTLCSFITSKR